MSKIAKKITTALESHAADLAAGLPVRTTTVVSVRLDAAMSAAVKARADELDITVSALCGSIIERAMQGKRKVTAPPRPTGLAAMSPEVARRVKSLGGKARKKS